MTTSLFVALIGDLILLPCLLFMRPSKAVDTNRTEESTPEARIARQVPPPHIGQPRRSTDPTEHDDDAEGCFA